MSTRIRSPQQRDQRTLRLLQGAETAARQRQNHAARRLLKAVLRHDPANDQALLRLVYLAEDDRDCLSYLSRFLDAHPHHPQARHAMRWARLRVATSKPLAPTPLVTEKRRVNWRSAVLACGLVVSAALIGLVILWGLGRQQPAAVRAGAPVMDSASSSPSATARPLWQVIRVAVPLFTPTRPIMSTPVPTSAPSSSSASVPVVGRPQTYNLSCESRSAVDLAAFWGVTVDELEFLAALGQSDNPHRGFVGDATFPPGSLPPYGYGVYAEPVAATLRVFGLDAQPVYFLGLEGLRAELLAGRPVLVWATYGLEPYEPMEWASSDGGVSTVVPYMHTFVVTGFDEAGVFLLDAYDATVRYYSAEAFLNAWGLFDQMAVTATGPL